MEEKNISISQRENYEPSEFTEFLWWLATAERELIIDCVVDRNRYRIIGMTVLATWAFATLAWTYFFSTVVDKAWLYLPLGFFMGFIVLCIDRALIKGINKSNKRKFTPLVFRGFLALTIGMFMAQPAILYIFDKEIRMQSSLDNEKRKMVKRQELDSLYNNRKTELLAQKSELEKSLLTQSTAVDNARQNFIAEADGSGGTGKVGIREIALAKKNEYEKLDEAYQQLQTKQLPKLESVDKELQEIEGRKQKEEQVFIQYLNDGFLTRAEALNNLLKDNPALQFRYYLIVVILMLIELMPVITKSMLPAGAYDEKVFWREELEKEMTQSNIKKERELKEAYNMLVQENNMAAIRELFELSKEDRTEKIRSFSKKWRDNDHHSFDNMWGRMKKGVLSKYEN